MTDILPFHHVSRWRIGVQCRSCKRPEIVLTCFDQSCVSYTLADRTVAVTSWPAMQVHATFTNREPWCDSDEAFRLYQAWTWPTPERCYSSTLCQRSAAEGYSKSRALRRGFSSSPYTGIPILYRLLTYIGTSPVVST
jgi:hypothetical protein